MMKKLFSLMLALSVAASAGAAGTVSAGAEEESDLFLGCYVNHGKYRKPQDDIVTQHLMFAMPQAWQNDITEDPRCHGAAGIYWWNGWDNSESRSSWSGSWPGYECDKVEEEGVPNLYSIDMPNFGNGEEGNGTMIIWNNYIVGGTETDPAKNPFREAAQQTRDFQAGYYSRYDQIEKYEDLFRYIYKYNLEKLGVEGASDLNLKSETFWEDINRISAKHLKRDFDSLDAESRTFVVDEIMDDNELDFSVFGDYASNFFNSDTVSKVYPNEVDDDDCISFHFDNMVFVVDLIHTDKMEPSPISGKIGFDGDFFFYYGNGDYGTWPTKELNEEMGGESGNFTIGYGQPVPATPDEPAPDTPDEPASGKIYFYAETAEWENYKNITCFIYNHSTGEYFFPWGSKKGNMTDEGNGIWSFDLAEKGYFLLPEYDYGVIFTADWNRQTTDLILDADNISDMAYCTGETEGSYSDPEKATRIVQWRSGVNGRPVTIDSLGNVKGDSYWRGETPYSLFKDFLMYRIDLAVRFTGQSYKEMMDETAVKLGLSDEEVARAMEETGRCLVPYLGDVVTTNGMVFTRQPDNTYILTEYTGSSSDLTIPKTLGVAVYSGTIIGSDMPSVSYIMHPVTGIGNWAFANNKTLQCVEIPDSIRSIGEGAFYNCVSLRFVSIPDSVASLGANAFEKCLYLEGAVLGDGITAINDETFFDCRRLKMIRVPEGVTAIGAEAFSHCRSLNTLLIPKSVTTIEKNTFANCPQLTLYGFKNSFAEQFAADADIAFINVRNMTVFADVIGDMDGDRKLTVSDATQLQRYLAEMLGEDAPDITDHRVLAYMDVNGDNNVSIADVTVLQRYLAEMIESFR